MHGTAAISLVFIGPLLVALLQKVIAEPFIGEWSFRYLATDQGLLN